ncbi:MAG TPA: vanadium-dependent haloperoxidase, partial [Acidimicrobiia bacterium]|nr:vanadium-dependent haloperoxidase [Acidimicrobiia bacterium]
VHPTRSFAVMHAAIYDAVVSVTGGRPYLFAERAKRGARPDAAAASAAHDTLAALYPSAAGQIDGLLATELGAMPDGSGKTEGVDAGRAVAAGLLAARADDGALAVGPPPAPGSAPGAYRPTPPKLAPPVFTHWGQVRPFVLTDGAQFRPTPPPALTSPAYARALNEVRDKGRDTAPARTADETATAQFWGAPIWNYWNEIAQGAATRHGTGLVTTARLFAVLNLAIADDVIAFYDAKYHYAVWRPVTAIREADGDGNPATTGDPNWMPLSATPADPSYPGAHSAVSAAAATVLSGFFGNWDRLTVTSEAVPGATRTFPGYRAAATEAGLSRIAAGVHTRTDHDAGTRLGRRVAAYVLRQWRSTWAGKLGR